MNRKVGVWIDHSQAVVVVLDGEQVETKTVTADIERRGHAKGGAPSPTPYGAQDAVYEGRRDRQYQHHLEEFYARVRSETAGAAAILLIGPGEAKTEFRKNLEDSGSGKVRIESEAADKLTEPQIVAKVKAHYGYVTRATE